MSVFMNAVIGSVIVLYNPISLKEISENIRSYAGDVDLIVLVDNSENKNNYDSIINTFNNIKYYPMNTNIGLAAAMNFGCKKVIEDGCDYILLLDQDSIFKDGSFALMKKEISSKKLYASLYAPNISPLFRENGKRVFNDRLIYPIKNDEIRFAITSGTLLNVSDYEEVGGFDEKLFIAQVDQDFCCNLLCKKKRMIRIGKAILFQEFGKPKKRNFFGMEFEIYENSPLRFYYISRNEILLRKKWGEKYRDYKVSILKNLVQIIFQEKRREKISKLLRGVYDGIVISKF